MLIFTSREAYRVYVTDDSGPELVDNPGYYSMRTNRIVLLAPETGDTTGPGRRTQTAAAERFFRTLVHEGTHQLAYNCGLHTRYADNPVWLTEGMAMLYEALSDDLRRDALRWQTVDGTTASTSGLLKPLALRTHPERLQTFRESLKQRPADSLTSLVATDERFRSDASFAAAYAEAWAFSHYLLTSHREEYIAFLSHLQKQPRLVWASADERRAAFEESFGPLDELNADFLRHVRRLRR